MFNLEKMIVNTDNIFDIPSVPCISDLSVVPAKWLSFADLSSFDGVYADYGLHFYTSDRNFESVWMNPARYVPIFKRFSCVVMPDFSLYYDMPLALQIYNKYRSHWLAQFFAFQGVIVIPNVNVNLPKNDYILMAGYPFHSILSVSSLGSVRSPEERQIFTDSFERILNGLFPLEILHFSSCSNFRVNGANNIYIKGGYNG